jgi:hypothetical protein
MCDFNTDSRAAIQAKSVNTFCEHLSDQECEHSNRIKWQETGLSRIVLSVGVNRNEVFSAPHRGLEVFRGKCFNELQRASTSFNGLRF